MDLNSVWDLIAPAQPDSLREIEPGLYAAIWWAPVPRDEVDRLLQTPGINIHDEHVNPRSLPGGVIVYFSVRSG
ncbi:MAG: hypothetical protein HZC41_21580 [Chloroflexi bacterium]|nr:hypothetical protein [Chloroflexota bacterium]